MFTADCHLAAIWGTSLDCWEIVEMLTYNVSSYFCDFIIIVMVYYYYYHGQGSTHTYLMLPHLVEVLPRDLVL